MRAEHTTYRYVVIDFNRALTGYMYEISYHFIEFYSIAHNDTDVTKSHL